MENTFQRLGQAGILLRLGGKTLLLDAFLSDMPGRRIPSPATASQLTGVDFVLGTHDHPDHIDRGAWPLLAKASPRARFLAPACLTQALAADLDISPERFVGLEDGESVTVEGFTFSTVAAAHEVLQPDAYGRHACLSVMVGHGGRRVLHMGDACPYPGLEAKLAAIGKPDVLFVPINGRDAYRLANGICGNFTYQEAAELAHTLGAHLTVPVHYDMFTGNLENPDLFLDYATVKFPGLNGRVCGVGETIPL